ncbi:hypothetical protein C1H76_0287 [Elsinoe australis]|uniref:DUF7729 domain-containing protein n=1 Tax=Elsinoe australis TaxID=40998 RepID=A0A4U7BCA7_9PEZI|nr:hypothetical protein C1H76_0287 [Elsinoe australis]
MAEHTFHHEQACFDETATCSSGHTTTQHNHHGLTRPISSRRKGSRYTATTNDLHLSLISILLLILASFPIASASVIPNRRTPESLVFLEPYTAPEEIIFDRSPPPARTNLIKRADSSTTHDPILVAGSESTTSTSKKEYTGETIISDTSESPTTALPTPFDTTLGNNFTSTQCLPFFQSFLSNATFNACLPFSLLMQTSSSFFQALRTPALLSRTLDATCNVNVTDCSLLMSTLNTQLRTNSICGTDLSRQNPVVVQAAAGFAAYDTLYRAACLKSRTTTGSTATSSSASSSSSSSSVTAGSTYCFAEAATNTSAPDSLYTYFLPLGMKLPADAHPACTGCLKDTMAAFAQSATVKGQAVAGTYLDAARTVDKWCGEGFAREDVKVAAVSSGGGKVGGGPGKWWIGLVAAVGTGMWQVV